MKVVGLDKKRLAALQEHFDDLVDDEEFWRFQAHSLAVLATPDRLRTFRLAKALTPMVAVSDHFHLKPLLRAITFPHSALVLALSENAVRLVEIFAQLPPVTVKVGGLPRDAASAAGKSTLNDRSPSGRIQGAEGSTKSRGARCQAVQGCWASGRRTCQAEGNWLQSFGMRFNSRNRRSRV